MTEWHVTPDYIVNNWTDELLDLMIKKLTERKEREHTPETPGEAHSEGNLARMGSMVKVIDNRGN